MLLIDPKENMPVTVKTFGSSNEITTISEESRRGFLFIGLSTGKLLGICTKQLKTILSMDIFMSSIQFIKFLSDNNNDVDLIVTSIFGELAIVRITPE